jgi:hypothetical protein
LRNKLEVLIPAHLQDVFNAQKFSEDEFILGTTHLVRCSVPINHFSIECRQRVPLESVLADLKKFSSVLEVELVELINKVP